MKLKPCPFCGGQPVYRETVEHYEADADVQAGSYRVWSTVHCDNCGIERSDEYRDEAVALWNKRARKR